MTKSWVLYNNFTNNVAYEEWITKQLHWFKKKDESNGINRGVTDYYFCKIKTCPAQLKTRVPVCQEVIEVSLLSTHNHPMIQSPQDCMKNNKNVVYTKDVKAVIDPLIRYGKSLIFLKLL
jgi:hypothetical protein